MNPVIQPYHTLIAPTHILVKQDIAHIPRNKKAQPHVLSGVAREIHMLMFWMYAGDSIDREAKLDVHNFNGKIELHSILRLDCKPQKLLWVVSTEEERCSLLKQSV